MGFFGSGGGGGNKKKVPNSRKKKEQAAAKSKDVVGSGGGSGDKKKKTTTTARTVVDNNDEKEAVDLVPAMKTTTEPPASLPKPSSSTPPPHPEQAPPPKTKLKTRPSEPPLPKEEAPSPPPSSKPPPKPAPAPSSVVKDVLPESSIQTPPPPKKKEEGNKDDEARKEEVILPTTTTTTKKKTFGFPSFGKKDKKIETTTEKKGVEVTDDDEAASAAAVTEQQQAPITRTTKKKPIGAAAAAAAVTPTPVSQKESETATTQKVVAAATADNKISPPYNADKTAAAAAKKKPVGKLNMNKFAAIGIPGSSSNNIAIDNNKPSSTPSAVATTTAAAAAPKDVGKPQSETIAAAAPAKKKPGKLNLNKFAAIGIPGTTGGGSGPPPPLPRSSSPKPPSASTPVKMNSPPSPSAIVASSSSGGGVGVGGGNGPPPSKPGKLNIAKFATLQIPGMGGGGGGGGGGKGPIDTNDRMVAKGDRPGMIDIFASARKIKDAPENQGQANMSDKAKQTLLAPVSSDDEDEDWNYLYELAVNYDKYKAEEAEATKKNPNRFSSAASSAAPADSDDDANAPAKPADVKNKLNNLFGGGGRGGMGGGMGGVNMTANGSFLNDQYFDKYIEPCGGSSGFKLQFVNETGLFKRFRTKDEQRSISEQYATALLKHPRANQITQLNFVGSLLPDAFLKALCETCLSQKGLPKLQVLNLESNDLGRDGIESLSKIIADPKTWRYLQILKLENQKRDISGGAAEEALGDAVVLSESLVQVGLKIKGGVPQQQVSNTIRMNMDKLRKARRKHAAKKGTLKARKRNEMELFFDSIAANTEKHLKEVDLTDNLRFLGLNSTERTKTGSAFATNTYVTKITMTKLKLDDDFAEAFGTSLSRNSTLETVVLDSNSFSGKGILAIMTGLGQNKSVTNFQIRHQSKKISSSEEELLPNLLQGNTTLLKLGTDVRNPLIRTKLERKLNENRDQQRNKRRSTNNNK